MYTQHTNEWVRDWRTRYFLLCKQQLKWIFAVVEFQFCCCCCGRVYHSFVLHLLPRLFRHILQWILFISSQTSESAKERRRVQLIAVFCKKKNRMNAADVARYVEAIARIFRMHISVAQLKIFYWIFHQFFFEFHCCANRDGHELE